VAHISSGLEQMAPDPYTSVARCQISAPVVNHGFVCDVAGCNSRPFARRGDLTRHKHGHNPRQLHDCPASTCNRKGTRGFFRKDKLFDHILAGHDEDTPFICPECGDDLPRDVVALHLEHRFLRGTPLTRLDDYRTCPLPRCSFKVRCTRSGDWSQKLQSHLCEKHDTMERRHYTNLLQSRGYDAQSGKMLCPICPSGLQFSHIPAFSEHFVQIHFDGPVCSVHTDDSCVENCYGQYALRRLRTCTSVPNEVRQHRRTMLRIWPDFADYRGVWDDIRCRGWTG
jgi:hypothetical protein